MPFFVLYSSWGAPFISNAQIHQARNSKRSATHYNQRSALFIHYALSRVYTIVLPLMWLPPRSQYCLLFLSLAYLPQPTTSTPLLSLHLLPLCTKSKLTSLLTPATPESVCRSGVHKLTLHRKKNFSLWVPFLTYHSHAVLVRKLSFYADKKGRLLSSLQSQSDVCGIRS